MKKILTFLSLICIGLNIFGQSSQLQTGLNKTLRLPADTSKKKTNGIAKHLKHRKMILAPDTLTMSDYMISIERINDNLNAVQDSVRLGFEVVGMGRRINEISSEMKLIRQNIRKMQSSLNIRNIYLYQSFTSQLSDDNEDIRSNLNEMYNRVYHAKLKIKNLLSDSIFRRLYADSSLRSTFDDKLSRVERKWAKTDSTTRANIDSLNILKMNSADNTISLSNMLSAMDSRLDKARLQLFKPDVCFLWKSSGSSPLITESTLKKLSILTGEEKVISYYFKQTLGEKGLVILFGVLLFVWFLMKRKLLKQIKEQKNALHFLQLHYLSHHPMMSLLVVILCLMPFFDAYAPNSYIAIEYLLVLSAVSIIFYKRENKVFQTQWFILVGLYVVDTLAYLLAEPSTQARIWIFLLHIGILAFLVYFYQKQNKEATYYKWNKVAITVGMILTSIALLCNIMGRFALSGLFGIAGIFSVSHAIILPIFVDTIIEIILLQLGNSRIKKGFNAAFDSSIVTKKIKGPLMIVSLLLWLIMISSNLDVYHFMSNQISEALSATRTIGSISFQISSVLMFFMIIWFAHILQRLISFLFGETGSDSEETNTVSKGQHSRLLITRLLVLIGGYLLAIAASGLPIDKLTFLLGALGVGIGMGLQNIVNNFVSGIILIFDGSLQMGDEIEINGQAGKVKGIGLRASTLSTSDGADVIIPNGNILSQNIVNWTFSNDQKRVTLEFWVIGKELDANTVNEMINATIKKIPHVIVKRHPVILYTKVNQDACCLTVKFWSDIHQTDHVKSEAMQKLSAAFNAKGIGFE